VARRPHLTRDGVLRVLVVGALAETAWTVFLAWRLPGHYRANHWDVAWVGIDAAQVAMLLASAWAAWRRRAVLIFFATAAGTLLLVDAWFDTLTARYSDFEVSALMLIVEVPWALTLFAVALLAFRRVTGSPSWFTSLREATIPPPGERAQRSE